MFHTIFVKAKIPKYEKYQQIFVVNDDGGMQYAVNK